MNRVSIYNHCPNCVTVRLSDRHILFSYNTPVAVWLFTDHVLRAYRLQTAPSRTTAKHLAQHGPREYQSVSAAELEALIGS